MLRYSTRLRNKMVECCSVEVKPPVKRARRSHLSVEDERVVKKETLKEVKQETLMEIKRESEVKTEGQFKSIDDGENEIGSQEMWFPDNFHEIYENIKVMRTWVEAPVDTMEGNPDETPQGPDERFLILFSLMISSRTKDTLNIKIMKKLKENGLNLQYVLDRSEEDLAEDIKPVNFYKTKAKNIKKTAEMLVDRFNGDIPKTIKELISLPGVGPKMGYLCLKAAWDIMAGIGVDTHVHRLSNLFGWVRTPTKEPEGTRKALESWLPMDQWDEFNQNLVGFGQTICNPYRPKCEECLNNKICPGAFKFKTKKTKS